MSQQTLYAMVNKKLIRTYNHLKSDEAICNPATAATAKETGTALELQKCDNLAVIDIDINHNLTDDVKAEMRKSVIDKLIAVDPKWPIVMTGNGGLHIYCLDNDFATELGIPLYNKKGEIKNRFVREIHGDNIEVDLFSSRTNKDNRSLVMQPGGKIKTDSGSIAEYQFINGRYYSEVKHSVVETLELLGLEYESPTDEMLENLLEKVCNKDSTDDKLPELADDEITPEQAVETNDEHEKPSKELFDALVQGLKGVEIHGALTNNSNDEVALPAVAASLYWCQSDDITEDDVEDALRDIKKNGKLTKNCKLDWGKRKYDGYNLYEKGTHTGIGYIINAVKVHNPEYFDEHVKPLLKPSCNEAEPEESFTTSSYTIEDFQRDFPRFTRPYQLIAKLKLCVAVNTRGGYIVKQRSNNTIEYQSLKRTAFDDFIGKDTFEYETTEDERQKMKEQKKAIKEFKAIKIKDIVSNSMYRDNFETFNGFDMMSDTKDVLQLYQPPATTKYNEQLVLDWIAFMKSRINNPEAFDELLDSHAYRFRHPTDFIEKFFINYGSGSNCKSYLSACLAELYPNYANVAVQQSQIENDAFNAWTVRNLLLWIEEAEQSNYQTKSLQQKIKQMTTKQVSTRGLYTETKNGRNWAIVGMNTNSKDLYGLVRADEATISRLVILDFKKNTMERSQLDQQCKYFIKHPEFAYSLYHYLLTVREINLKFSPVRYYGEDKRQILERMTMASRNSVEDWFAECYTEEGLVKTALISKVEYKYMFEADANTSYLNWRSTQQRSRMCINSIKNSMIDMGFEHKNKKVDGKPVHTWRITTDKFNELIKKLNPIDSDDDDEEWEDVEDSANNNGIELIE